MRYFFNAPADHTLEAGGVIYRGGEEVPEELAGLDPRVQPFEGEAPVPQYPDPSPSLEPGTRPGDAPTLPQTGEVDDPGVAENAETGELTQPGEPLPSGDDPDPDPEPGMPDVADERPGEGIDAPGELDAGA